MIINKYDAHCTVCKTSLSAGLGFVYRDEKERWKAVCTSIQCVQQACPNEIESYKKIMSKKKDKKLSFNGVVECYYDEGTLKLIKAMPGALYDSSIKRWKVSTLPEDRNRVLEIAKKLELEVELIPIEKSKKHQSLLEKAQNVGAYPYQIEGIRWLLEQGNCILADQQGLGKSNMTLLSMDDDYGHIIVSPSHLKLNWKDEAERWRPDLEAIVVKSKKDFILPKKGEIVIISYGLLPDWLDLPPKKRKLIVQDDIKQTLGQTVVIYDEVQALKSSKTKQSKRAKQLTRLCKKAVGLTGTPIMNKQIELWNICVALNIEKRIFGNFIGFLKYFNGRKSYYGYTFGEPRPELPEILRRGVLRRVQDEVGLQLPSDVYTEIKINTDSKIRRSLDSAWDLYKKSESYNKEELPNITEISKIKKELAESKIKTLKDVVSDLEEKGICPIVFSSHREPVLEMGRRDGWNCIHGGMTPEEKHKVKDLYQAGKLKGLAATIKACGTGLTLTYGNHVVFNDLDWVPANNSQAEYRVKRLGQKEDKVFYYHLVADHPIDRHIHKLLLQKMRLSKKTLEGEVILNQSHADEEETEKDFDERIQKNKEENLSLIRETISDLIPVWVSRYKIKEIKSFTKAEIKKLKKNLNDVNFYDENEYKIVKLIMKANIDTNECYNLLEKLIDKQEER